MNDYDPDLEEMKHDMLELANMLEYLSARLQDHELHFHASRKQADRNLTVTTDNHHASEDPLWTTN